MASLACRAAVGSSSLVGLRSANRVDRVGQRPSAVALKPVVSRRKQVTCALDAPVVISAATAVHLALGRLVFLPFHRASLAQAGLPVQNGVTHYEAGDKGAKEAEDILKTNDPAGFTLIDTLAWGALGHAAGFFILATASNGYASPF